MKVIKIHPRFILSQKSVELEITKKYNVMITWYKNEINI